MKPRIAPTLFAYALASALAFPPLGFASGAKTKVEEHESVDVEHRTTHEQRAVESDATPTLSPDHDEHQDVSQEVKTEHKEIRRELKDQEESHHDD